MKLSLRGEYALRALIALGQAKPEEIVPIHVVSEKQQVPKRFLEQILNDLRAGGFVESKRGISGGYRLARLPQDIRLADVIEHIEGVLASTSEPVGKFKLHGEARDAQTAITGVVKEVHEVILKVLNHITLADLCDRAHKAGVYGDIADYAI
jgi:Rrf2 family protein